MKKSRFKKFITTNPWLKLTSLVLASMLWFFVISKGRSVIIMEVPLGFKNIPTNMKVINSQQKVSISIEGHERLLQKLRFEEINMVMDLANAKEGDVILPVTAESVALPKPLTVIDISPQTIKLKIEAKEKKSVYVRAIIIGSPASGFRVEKIVSVPDMVQIEGPRSVIEKIFNVKTEPIDITGIASGFQYSAQLDVSEKNIKTDPTEVMVSVVTKKVQQK